jgi:hypothetical protein
MRGRDAPNEVRFDRKPRHTAFGYGMHTCIGRHLARRELKITLGEVPWLGGESSSIADIAMYPWTALLTSTASTVRIIPTWSPGVSGLMLDQR